MKKVIAEIIREGWMKNQSVMTVVGNIEKATGLLPRFALEQFCSMIFTCKPAES